jgi:transposase
VIDRERWAEARRLHGVEKLSFRAIARRLHMDPKTIKRALAADDFNALKRNSPKRGSIIDPYRALIRTYSEDDDLSAVQIFDRLMAKHGYKGEITLVRHVVREVRRNQDEAFLRLTYLPGACAQVDWAHLGRVTLGRTSRRVSAFVMVLAYSRLMYVELTLSEKADAFLEAHVRAFNYFGGVPQRLLYDNCKTVVLQRLAGEVKFHPRLLELAGQYLFKVKACPPRKPWHKGRVESGIKYVRSSFQRGRAPITSLELEQRDITTWRDNTANQRNHATTHRKPKELFEEAERKALLPLPEKAYDTAHVETVSANKHYRVFFDGNAYTVPHELAHKKGLILRATTTAIEIYARGEHVAHHQRSYDRGVDVLDEAHDRGLREKRRRADRDLELSRFVAVLGAEAETYAVGLAHAHVRASHHLRRILALVERYGPADVRAAMLHVLAHNAFGADYVENALHQERRRRLAGPASATAAVRDAELASVSLIEPDLTRFDHLFTKGTDHGRESDSQSQPGEGAPERERA